MAVALLLRAPTARSAAAGAHAGADTSAGESADGSDGGGAGNAGESAGSGEAMGVGEARGEARQWDSSVLAMMAPAPQLVPPSALYAAVGPAGKKSATVTT